MQRAGREDHVANRRSSQWGWGALMAPGGDLALTGTPTSWPTNPVESWPGAGEEAQNALLGHHVSLLAGHPPGVSGDRAVT